VSRLRRALYCPSFDEMVCPCEEEGGVLYPLCDQNLEHCTFNRYEDLEGY
jgi:hypothetical protein